MSGSDRETESTDALDRRTVLKGTAVAGLAGGGVTGTASAGGWNEIVFTSVSDEVFEYWFEVSGEVKRGGTYRSDAWDDVGEDRVHGASDDEGSDSFLFTGNLEKLRLKGPGKVFVDGDLVEDTTKREKRLPNEITIEAEGDFVRYKFRVSGRVEKGESANENDRVLDSNVVRGSVGGKGSDDYRYSGAIAFDEADGPVTVTLDVDPN